MKVERLVFKKINMAKKMSMTANAEKDFIEKMEHIKLIGWLNELLVQKGEKEIKIPKQFK